MTLQDHFTEGSCKLMGPTHSMSPIHGSSKYVKKLTSLVTISILISMASCGHVFKGFMGDFMGGSASWVSDYPASLMAISIVNWHCGSENVLVFVT